VSGELKKEGQVVITLRENPPDEVELVLEGRLAREDTPAFQEWLDRALQSGRRAIALNFAGLTNLSSTAIGKLWHFKNSCDELGRHLVIRNCAPAILQLLKMIRFDEKVRIEPGPASP
jgi:anti-anti-sigma factor